MKQPTKHTKWESQAFKYPETVMELYLWRHKGLIPRLMRDLVLLNDSMQIYVHSIL